MPDVEIINATENPVEQICLAARNDYRPDGVIGHSFDEIMEGARLDPDHLAAVIEENPSHHLGGYISEDVTEWSTETQVRFLIENNLDTVPDFLVTEAKKRSLVDTLIGGTSGHWGPLEHVHAQVAIEGVTRVLMAQLTRHRHATFDVMSLRYVGLDDGFEHDDAGIYQPPDDEKTIRDRITDRFQIPEFRGEDFEVTRDEGVSEFDREAVDDIYLRAYRDAVWHYLRLLDEGVPQEQARKVLPMGTKVNIVATMNAREWMHVLQVRQKGNVQGETRRCAEAINDALSEWMPYVWDVYENKNFRGLAP